MPINVPSNPKIYTTKYADFRGVDFTNDPSNVWYRRSPDAVNMLPDEAGKPFKRTGWEIAVSASQIASKYASDKSAIAPSEVAIRKCYYFTLHGLDHIVIFTGLGMFIYRQKEDLTSELISSEDILSYYTGTTPYTSDLSYDPVLMESYERAFFFEGGGKSQFYIYGDFKVWEYFYGKAKKETGEEYGDYTFVLREAETYIPRVNIAIDAKHTAGEPLEGVNLFSDYIAEDYTDNIYLSVSTNPAPSITDKDGNPITGAVVSADDYQFTTYIKDISGTTQTFVFTYTLADHSWLLSGDQVYISNYGITVGYTGEIPDGAKITVVVNKAFRINLGRTITDITGMKVYVSRQTMCDTEITLVASGSPTAQQCVLSTEAGGSYITFYQSELPLVSGEDSIRVVFPRNLATRGEIKQPSATLTAKVPD